ncbi:MAG: hypothetical protein ACK5O8_08530 [Pirellula sp.]
MTNLTVPLRSSVRPLGRTFGSIAQRALIALLVVGTVSSTGCITLISNLLWVIGGNEAPAEFKDLQEKRVAVVVTTDGSGTTDASSIVMSRQIASLLSKHGKKIDVVNPEEVDRVVRDVGPSDVSRIGSRLKADYLIAVDIRNLKLKEGQTLYRGVCDCSLSVHKVADGDQVVFAKDFSQFAYPMTGGVHITETNDATFRGMYLSVLANRVARNFYRYDPTGDVGLDAATASLPSN